jgi:hypothetical protein
MSEQSACYGRFARAGLAYQSDDFSWGDPQGHLGDHIGTGEELYMEGVDLHQVGTSAGAPG